MQIPEETSQRLADGRRERDEIRAGCEADFCPNWVSSATRDAVWHKAWDDGHSHGQTEVRYHYDDLMDIVRTMSPLNPTVGQNVGQETPDAQND